ncbi:hypothetical protein BGZ60DRAFT_404207 [Tricladium varicosporioides]|nr:hypothetical protein BGZ60DRAFT_404207 [Hymenoscyphus varicosporioides]
MDRLPLELLHKICVLLENKDLKSIRITSSRLQPAAELVLFQTIHVRYSLESLENLRNISCHPNLRLVVRFIDYNFLSVDEHDIQTRNFASWVNSTVESGLCLSSDQIDGFIGALTTDELIKYQSSYSNWMHHQNGLACHQTMTDYLTSILQQLEHLNGFHFSGLDHRQQRRLSSPPMPWSGSYGGTCQIISLESTESGQQLLKDEITFWDFFDAARISQLREISMSRLMLASWNSAASRKVEDFETLSKLETLSLDFRFGHRITNNQTSLLRAMLTNSPVIRSLHVSFDEMIYIEDIKRAPDQTWKVVSLSDMIPTNHHFRHLKYLSLEALITTELDFRIFLKAHKTTLRFLVLSQVHFGFRDGSNLNPGSWVEFFQFLNEEMDLESAQFYRYFSNYWDEIWRFGIKDRQWGPECSKSRVERYATRQGPNPFTSLDNSPKKGVLRWKVEDDDSLRNFGGL